MMNNGYGEFSEDGREYIIKINKNKRTPTPWSHILTNGRIGTIITTNGGGSSWYVNSRENKLTTWTNNVLEDRATEFITISDGNLKWYATPIDKSFSEEYEVVYGFGYAKVNLNLKEYKQSLLIFVSNKLDEKVSILTIKNNSDEMKKINFGYFIEAVLGVDLEYTKKHIVAIFENNILKLFNRYNENYSNKITYIKIVSDKAKRIIYGDDINDYKNIACTIELDANEEIKLAFVLGVEKDRYKETSLEEYEKEFIEVRNSWENVLNNIQVETPDKSINIMLNGWLKYQTLASRLWGRASFYQSGGAFGFRDQLQDVLALVYTEPELVKLQIIYHSMQQFKEGDVLHWWHPEKNNGIRSRCSDDLLWLVYVVCEYIKVTSDYKILDIKTNFIEGSSLKDDEDDIYINVVKSQEKENLYEHCKRAIDKSLIYGARGLPLIGSGDWNDGMNEIHGESVWLGFFVYDILNKFLKICEYKEDEAAKKRYQKEADFIKNNIDKKAWDDEWYKRAFFNDGKVLGSVRNDECKIDSISQSWSVISGAGEAEKQKRAMLSLEENLVDNENKIIKLLTPPFNNTKLEPGYIKAYIPGVRENGGQYTHAAIWTIMAESMLGKNEKAMELYKNVLPIEHSLNKEMAEKYKVEPYVISADIYSTKNLEGMGGWTWYTGSASWCYITGIKNILGLVIEDNVLKFNPCVPKTWKEYKIVYKYKKSTYSILVKNLNASTNDVQKIILNGNEITEKEVKLNPNAGENKIEVIV